MRPNKLFLFGIAATFLLAFTPLDAVLAQDTAAIIIKKRQDTLKQLNFLTRQLNRTFFFSKPDKNEVRTQAREILEISNGFSGLFPKGSGTGDTGARPEIWQNQEDFSSKIQDLHSAASVLGAAAKIGDMNAASNALSDLGAACSACHRIYRERRF